MQRNEVAMLGSGFLSLWKRWSRAGRALFIGSRLLAGCAEGPIESTVSVAEVMVRPTAEALGWARACSSGRQHLRAGHDSPASGRGVDPGDWMDPSASLASTRSIWRSTGTTAPPRPRSSERIGCLK